MTKETVVSQTRMSSKPESRAGAAVAVASVAVFAIFYLRGTSIPPAVGAAVVTASLLYVLLHLARFASVLATGAYDPLDADGVVEAPLSQLRQEKQRVLRAIKELEFDHSLGKMSAVDFQEVLSRYRLRAVEINRQLDLTDQLHHEVAAFLERVAPTAADTEVTAAPATSVSAAELST